MMPMLACPLEIDRVTKYSRYTMEVKLDGVRCVAVKQDKEVLLYTRSGKDLTEKLPHIVQQLKEMPGSFVLDGELGYIDKYASRDWSGHMTDYPLSIDFNSTIRVLGSGVSEAIRKQEASRIATGQVIKFIVFDFLSDGVPTSTPQGERRDALINFMVDGQCDGGLRDLWLSTEWPRFDDAIYTFIVEHGGEGVMLKNPTAAYWPAKRKANTWYKLKKFDTIDAKIIGKKMGEGKYENQIGALWVKPMSDKFDGDATFEGTETFISGMSDAERWHMTTYFDTLYEGKMCEFKYFGYTGKFKEGYRFPQFLRMRPDKD